MKRYSFNYRINILPMPLKKNNLFLSLSYIIMALLIVIIILVLKDDLLVAEKLEPNSTISLEGMSKVLPMNASTSIITRENKDKNPPQENSLILINDVPFMPQAPYANWGDIIYEE